MESIINKSIIKSYTDGVVFDNIIEEIEKWYERPAHDLVEMRNRESKKAKGTSFELFAQVYLRHFLKNVKEIWLLEEVPQEILGKLGLKRKDYGIDIIIMTQKNTFIAVQAKYRKRGRASKTIITWKMLSTFYSLCSRSGPWERLIVITNADYITHMGYKNSKDLSICYQRLITFFIRDGNFSRI
jgi:predicted helicase